MIMKVFAKGQVVIPAHVRQKLGIAVGENLEVHVDEKRRVIELSRAPADVSRDLAGSLAGYRRGKPFPARQSMHDALAGGLSRGRQSH